MEDVPRTAYRFASSLFMRAGGTFIVPADKINDVIPVNGSSPAFFFRLVELMAQEAENHGIQKEMAVMMAAQTMAGAADMLMKSGKTPAQLTEQVCSPGGTTLAALTAFDELGLDQMVKEAFARCIQRAEELGK
jgi:pyrroline-5-carboxylate reductase